LYIVLHLADGSQLANCEKNNSNKDCHTINTYCEVLKLMPPLVVVGFGVVVIRSTILIPSKPVHA